MLIYLLHVINFFLTFLVMLGGVGNYSMDSKGIKQLHKQVEELHTESRVASGSEQRETKCAIPPRVCVIVLFLSNPCCSYIIFLPCFHAKNRKIARPYCFCRNFYFILVQFQLQQRASEYVKQMFCFYRNMHHSNPSTLRF